MDRVAEDYSSRTPIVGLAVAVARDGEIVHEAAYGLARLDPEVPMRVDTPMEIFSVGKIATAVLALRLAERGDLDLDAPIGALVPEVGGDYAPATLRQLLRHSSGLAEQEIDEVDPAPRFLDHPSRGDVLAWIEEGERVAGPNETWLYNGSGFVLAGIAAEEATASGFPALVRTELRDPAGVDAFGYCPDLDPERAQGYMIREDTPEPIPPIDFAWFGGAGSLCATAGDLVRWWRALRAGSLVGPDSLAQMTTPVTLERDALRAEFGYGLGLRLGEYGGHRMLGHTGNGAGGTAVLAEYPEERLVIAVITNTAGRGVPHALEIEAAMARAILAFEIGRPSQDPVPSAALAAAPGLYLSPEGAFCISADRDGLLLATDGGDPQTLLHQGSGRFQRGSDHTFEEFFLGWPNRIGWFGYRLHGFPMDLAVRTADDCHAGP